MRKIYLLGLALILAGSSALSQYCVSGGPSSPDDSNVESVTLMGDVTNLSSPGGAGGGGVTSVQDETAQVADLTAGNSYALNVTWGSCLNYYTGFGQVWIDYNGNQTFDASESVGTTSVPAGSTATTYNFTVPAGALNGTHRMRVMQREGATSTLDPCASYSWGSVTDFSITITGGSSCGPASALNISNNTGTSVSLNWTQDASATQNNVEWGFPGFTPGTGSSVGSASAVVGSTTTANTLTPDTDYEFYVQTDCGGSTAAWAGPFSFTTGYCSVSTNFSGDYLSDISTTGAIQNVSYSATTQPAGSYANETASQIISYAGGTFDISTTYVGGGNGVNVWVDWNNDLDFDDVGENVFYLADGNAVKTGTINVPGAQGLGNYRLRVRGAYGSAIDPPSCGSVDYGSTVDFTLVVDPAPSCTLPSALSSTGGTSTTVDLSWVENGSATNWAIEYGAPGFTPGTGTSVLATSNPFTITALTASTDYEFYVRSICAPGDTSNYSGPISFYTNYCLVSTTNTSDYLSAISTTGADQNVSYTTAAQPAGSYADETASQIMSYPAGNFDITTTYVGGSNGVNVWVDWNNDLDFDDAGENVFYLADGNAVKTGTINVPGAQGLGNYRVRVRGAYGLSANPPSCGNVSYGSTVDFTLVVGAAPSCLPPTLFSSTGFTATTVDLAWTDNAGATSWAIEYGAVGFTPGTGTSVLAGSNPFTVSGLTHLTDYDFYVRSICAIGDTSSYVGVVSVSTPLGNLSCTSGSSYVLYSNDFEGNFPSDWSKVSTVEPVWTYETGYTTSSNTGPSAAHSGTGYLYLETSNGSPGDMDTLYSPMVDLTNVSAGARITYYYHMYGNDMGTLTAQVSSDNVSWTTEWSKTGEVQTDELDPWRAVEIDLTSYLGGPIYVRFIGTRGTGYTGDIAIDLFNVEICTTCPPVSSLSSSYVATDSAEVAWVQNGTEASWTIEYGPTGFTPGTGTSVTSISNPDTLGGLIDNTVYDVYVTADCGGGDISTATGPLTVTTDVVCSAPINFAIEYASNDTISLQWTSTGLEASWNIEYGPVGFVPGTGAGTATTVNTIPDTTFGLSLGSVYDFYVQADCGAGLNNPWTGPITHATQILNDSTCDAVSVLVDGSTTTYSNIGATEQIGTSVSGFNTVWFNFTAPTSGHLEIRTCGNSFDNFLEVYEATDCSDFGTFNYVDGATGNPFATCNGTNDPAGINLCGLTPGNVYYLVIGSESNGSTGTFPLTLTELPGVNAGTGVPTDICEDNANLDLFTTISGNTTTSGQWYVTEAVSGNELPSTVNVVGLPIDTYSFEYVHTEICDADTVSTSITLIELPNVGTGSVLPATCNFGPVSLFDGLTGNVDLSGVWTDGTTAVGGSIVNFNGEAAGTYDYYFVVDNGVCAADSATVTVTLIDCLTLDENEVVMNAYPNPVKDLLTVQLMNTDAQATVELYNVQGRLVIEPINMNSSMMNINMSDVADGIYILKVTANGSTQEIRVVKE